MTEVKKSHFEFTGKHMLAVMLAFFGVIFGVNILMATLAIRSWTGLVVENTYVASQEFNGKLAASRAQAALNWQVELSYRDGELVFNLLDDEGRTLPVQRAEVDLTRPIGISQDRVLVLGERGEEFFIDEDVPSGVWNVIIKAIVSGYPDFEYRARLIVDAPATPLS